MSLLRGHETRFCVRYWSTSFPDRNVVVAGVGKLADELGCEAVDAYLDEFFG
jgi:hypothetical protein